MVKRLLIRGRHAEQARDQSPAILGSRWGEAKVWRVEGGGCCEWMRLVTHLPGDFTARGGVYVAPRTFDTLGSGVAGGGWWVAGGNIEYAEWLVMSVCVPGVESQVADECPTYVERICALRAGGMSLSSTSGLCLYMSRRCAIVTACLLGKLWGARDRGWCRAGLSGRGGASERNEQSRL